MRHVPPERWPAALALYALCGAAGGSGVAQSLAAHAGVRPGIGVAVVVNLALPACAVGIAAWYPRFRTVLAGATLLTMGMVLATMFRRTWRFWAWGPASLLGASHPVQVAATVGYAVVGAAAVALVRPFRVVGPPDADRRCACGYLLEGLGGAPCPECGTPAGRVTSGRRRCPRRNRPGAW